MKKILLEYANIIGYTITGLIFGLSFFLLFINFYHSQELSYVADVSEYNTINKDTVSQKIATIRANLSVYNQANYSGNLNIYGLNTAQIKLEECLKIIESPEMMAYFEKKEIQLKDSYNFAVDFKNKILNDCLVMQVKSMFNTDTVSKLPNFDIIKPYVELSLNNLLSSSAYVQADLENADHYFFNTNGNRTNFFDLVNDSYSNIMNDYQDSLDLLVEISAWFKSIVIGG